jgi:hypothetical protein
VIVTGTLLDIANSSHIPSTTPHEVPRREWMFVPAGADDIDLDQKPFSASLLD